MSTHGFISEIFPSLQGEGFFVGAMQLFIRMSGCNLRCRGCDSVNAQEQAPDSDCEVLRWPGTGGFSLGNPLTEDALCSLIEREFPLTALHSVAFTGGEPLQQSAFVGAVGRRLRNGGLRIFLETNGTLASEVNALLDVVDIWSVDLKLSCGWALPGNIVTAHQSFLAHLPQDKTWLKLIVALQDTPEAILTALGPLDTAVFPLVLQPYADPAAGSGIWDSASILEWVRILQPYFREIRWVPQVHKLLHIP